MATAIFPVMSGFAAKKDFAELCKTVSNGLRSTVFIAIPATIGLVIIARPLISVAFEHGRFTADDTTAAVWTLLFYTLGLTGFFAQQILTRAFYSMQDSKTPMKSALIAVVVNIVLNLKFVPQYGIPAAAYTTVFSFFVMFMMVFVIRSVIYRRKLAGR